MSTSIPVRIPSAQQQNVDLLYGSHVLDHHPGSAPEVLAWQRACALAADQLSHATPSPDASRLAAGLALAQGGHVQILDAEISPDTFATIQSGKFTYLIDLDGNCNCQDHVRRSIPCKHMLAVDVHLHARHPDTRPAEASPGAPSGASPQVVSPLPPPPTNPAPAGKAPRRSKAAPALPTQVVENPAGANFKARIGNNSELWFTWHDISDDEVLTRMQTSLPILQAMVEACEAQHQARTQVHNADLQTRIDQAVKAALAPALAQLTQNGAAQHTVSQGSTRAPSSDNHDPREADDWCAIHHAAMTWHPANDRGPGWYSHGLSNGRYCKGQ